MQRIRSTGCGCFAWQSPPGATLGHTLNSGYTDEWAAAVMTAEVNVQTFVEPGSPPKTAPTLNAATHRKHGLEPAAFGVVVSPRSEFMAAVERFESLAGLPSPRLDGVWNKISPAVNRSYFFLTDFRESQFDEALAMARRGAASTGFCWARNRGRRAPAITRSTATTSPTAWRG